MPVRLEIEGSTDRLVSNFRNARNEAQNLVDSYDDLKSSTSDMINISGRYAKQSISDSKKLNTEYGNQSDILEDLESHLKRLEKGQKKTQDPKLVKKYNSEIVKTRSALAAIRNVGVKSLSAVNNIASRGQKIFLGLRNTIATAFAPLTAVAGLALGIEEIVSSVSEYNDKALELSSITGLVGNDLEFLKQSAVEASLATESSASEVLDSYKLLASAKPELLGNAAALKQVADEAIVLSGAAGGSLSDNMLSLVDIMNQFNAPAEEANRYVNTLAAGSKEGSAEIEDLSASIVVAGTAAKSANVSLEESVGLLEALAERGVKGSQAGTALRNVILKLSATEILPKQALDRLSAAGVDIGALSDKTKSFSDRLKELKPIQNDANAITALFGLENQAAGQLLIQNAERAEELTKAVTGTNVAYEQAEIRSRSVNSQFQILQNTIKSLILENEGGLSSLLSFLIRVATNGVLFLKDGMNELVQPFRSIIDSGKELYNTLLDIFPGLQNAEKQTSAWKTAVEITTVPIKILFSIISAGITTITSIIKALDGFISRSPKLKEFALSSGSFLRSAFDVFLDLPSYTAGGFAAVQTFFLELIRSTKNTASNLGNVFSELFNFKKLVTEGTSGLKDAVSNLFTNEFSGIGEKTSESFNREFEKTKIKIPVEPVILSPSDNVDTTSNNTPTPTPDSPSILGPSEKELKEAEKKAKELEKLKIESLRDGLEKQLALEELRFNDLKKKLTDANLGIEEAISQHELNKFDIRQKFIDETADLEQFQGEERLRFVFEQTKKEIDALENQLKNASGGTLLESQQKQLNLLRKNASKEYLEGLKEFQSSELQLAQERELNLLELKRSTFESETDFEDFKEREILNIRLKYAEKQLEVLEDLNDADSDAILGLKSSISKIKSELSSLDKIGSDKEFNLFRLLGLNPDDKNDQKVINGLNTAAETAINTISEINQLRLDSAQQSLEAADREIKAIDDKISAYEKELNEQKTLNAQGFANSAQATRDEITLLQQQKALETAEREKALNEKKKIQKQQAALDTLTQGSSLITAAAQIFQSVAAIPFVGPLLGAALVAGMIASFAAAKVKVFQNINKQKAEKGLSGKIKGKRHTQGGEDFPGGIEAEDGEVFGILSRKASKKYGSVHQALTDAMNRGDERTITKLLNLYGGKPELSLSDVIQPGESNSEISINSKGLEENNKLLKRLLNTNKSKKVEYSGNKKIITRGNSKRIVNI